jgi:hypothetical protein
MQRRLPRWVGRQSTRRIVIWPATLSGNGSDRHCSVFNISEGGACLRIDDATQTPERAEVRITGVGFFSAKRVWVQHDRIGLAFLVPPDEIRPALDEAFANLSCAVVLP